MAKNLLVELFVEELPPKALKSLADAFSASIFEGLQSRELVGGESKIAAFATPRRLAVHITNVVEQAKDKAVRQKLMPVAVGLDGTGNATPALLKRLAALGLDAAAVSSLQRAQDGKAEALFIDTTAKGLTLVEGLQKALEEMLTKLPIPKEMTYQLADGWTTVKFVRPAHGLVALHGSDVVPVSLLGLTAGRTTQGHRFEAPQATLTFKDADTYASQLENEGAVMASFEARRTEIVKQLQGAAAKTGLKPVDDDELLDEVTALVERPNVLTCQFETEYLAVPQECLILTMKANQKYFPLLDANGRLSNQFLVVSNVRPDDASRVVEGNVRVVRPRLADAKFFYEQDRKKPLNSHLEGLGRVVYHNKLGSQLDRVNRLKSLAGRIADLGASAQSQLAQQAAELCKCDLLTLMVGEFPELQGIMGRYYALADGKAAEVAESIREHYLPRGAGDELPTTGTGMALALADKIDTIVGVFAIDQKPTGAKDPFGVRRAAIGVLRILIERQLPVDLVALIEEAVKQQPVAAKATVGAEIYDYIMERLRSYYLEGGSDTSITTEMFDAVLANRPVSPLDFDRRLRALTDFLKLGDAQSLAAANKRISNILRKSGKDSFGAVNPILLPDAAEKTLHDQVVAMKHTTAPLFAAREYGKALGQLASLRAAVDAFFDGVMVMAEDEALRTNRLALLAELRGLFAHVADLSRLPG
ncbi:MAG TPA: glycine--tRNA ligase subunit beta [Steroidobacteraceae bacterium]|nr:glycine--tRNA ligase subunit beta [Steroidobacteraceae bacterium]